MVTYLLLFIFVITICSNFPNGIFYAVILLSSTLSLSVKFVNYCFFFQYLRSSIKNLTLIVSESFCYFLFSLRRFHLSHTLSIFISKFINNDTFHFKFFFFSFDKIFQHLLLYMTFLYMTFLYVTFLYMTFI